MTHQVRYKLFESSELNWLLVALDSRRFTCAVLIALIGHCITITIKKVLLVDCDLYVNGRSIPPLTDFLYVASPCHVPLPIVSHTNLIQVTPLT